MPQPKTAYWLADCSYDEHTGDDRDGRSPGLLAQIKSRHLFMFTPRACDRGHLDSMAGAAVARLERHDRSFDASPQTLFRLLSEFSFVWKRDVSKTGSKL